MRIVQTLIFGVLGLWTLFCVLKFIGAILFYIFGESIILAAFGLIGFVMWRRMVVRKRKRRVPKWANQTQMNPHLPQNKANESRRRYSTRRSNSA